MGSTSNFFITDKTTKESAIVDSGGRLHTTRNGDVPIEYTKQTASGETFLVQKGQLNNIRLRPQVMNEQCESSREIQAVVTATNTVNQIFKASHDNINGINLTMESAAGVEFDDFEEYADSAALQAEWIPSGIVEAELDTTRPHTGINSMYLDLSATTPVGTQWLRTFTTTDFTGYTGQFWMYSRKEYKDVKLKVIVEDSATNQSKADIITAGKEQYFQYNFNVTSLVGTADLTDIVKIGFEVVSTKNDGEIYIDDMVSIPGAGQAKIKLFNMGVTLPVDGVTKLSDGTQYTKLGDLGISGQQLSEINVSLLGGKRMYHIDEFVAGVALEIPGNELLIPGNYYVISIQYVDTDINIYGPNASYEKQYYNNGYAFTAPDEDTAISAIGEYSDLMFIIFSTQEVFVYELTVINDGTPGDGSQTSVYVEDEDMQRTDILVSGIKAVPAITTMLKRPFLMTKGSKIEQEYNHDFQDDVSSINLIFQYYFIPPIVNG